MMTMFHSKRYPACITIAFCALLGLASCKVPRVLPLKKEAGQPARYSALPGDGADSTTIATLPRDIFFKDEHLKLLISDVLKGNPDIQIALRRVTIASQYFKMSKAAWLPEVNGMLRASGTKFGKYTMEGVGNFDTNLSGNIEEDQKVNTNPVPDFWFGLNATWEIDLWGKIRNRKKAAQLRFWATEAGRHWLTSILTAQTALLYYELMALDQEEKILSENLVLQNSALEIVRALKEAGKATELAVVQFETQLGNTRSAQYHNKRKVVEVSSLINTLAGRYEGDISRSSSFPDVTETAASIKTGIPAQLLSYRPDIKEAELELAATHADVRAARAAFFPELSISAYGALNSFNGNLLFSASSVAGQLLGGLTVPIFKRNELKSRFRIATAEQEQAFYQYRSKVINAYRELNNELSVLHSNTEVYRIREEQVATLSRGVSIANDLYLNGYANYLEIITAQKSKLDAQLELVETQRAILSSVVEIYKASGGGWND